MSQAPIMLYSFPTPNGIPVTIHIEELKAVYPNFNYEYVIQKLYHPSLLK